MLNTQQSPKMKLTAYTLMIPLVLLFIFVNNTGAAISNLTNSNGLKSVMGKISGIVPLNDTGLPLNLQATSTPTLQNNGFEIHGILVDEKNNQPLAGVNVIIGGTTTGTTSDTDGSFRLKVQEGDSILFSYIGYAGLTYVAKNKNSDTGTLQMKRKQEQIEEVFVVGYGMSNNPPSSSNGQPHQSISEQDEVFTVVEEMPEFPGGETELMSYIARAVKYPVQAQKDNIQGRVICEFIVDASGSIINAKVTSSVHPSLDSEALRIISLMPKWNPGKQRGKAVSVEYILPINFRLQN